MNRPKLIALVSLAAIVSAAYGGEEAFRGLRGEALLRAVREECRPSQYVADSYQWLMIHDVTSNGQLQLLLEGDTREISKGWPPDVIALQVLPAEWWQYDSQLNGLPARDMQNIVAGTLDFAEVKALYPPFRVDDPLSPFGMAAVGTVQFDGVSTGAWQPSDDMKGDVARIAMYMLAVYPAQPWDPWCSLLYSADGFSSQGLAIMMEWSRNDPVDERELRRAKAVAEAQGAMINPFVAWPGFEEYIWGSKVGELFLTESDSEVEKTPLRSTYEFADEKIWLYSPHVHPGATWRVDGAEVAESVSIRSLGVGNHKIEFTEPDGSMGSVIITITEWKQ